MVLEADVPGLLLLLPESIYGFIGAEGGGILYSDCEVKSPPFFKFDDKRCEKSDV